MIGALVAGITGSGGATLSSYESIATATGTGSSGTITFSSIPSTFKHLQIRGIARTTTNYGSGVLAKLRFNSDSGANYAEHWLEGANNLASAYGFTGKTEIELTRWVSGNGQTANVMGAIVVDILDYGSTTKNKTVRYLAGNDSNDVNVGYIVVGSGLWLSTSAITSLTLEPLGGNWTTSSTFALYGIKEA